MLAHDLGRGIALDALGTGVPAGYETVRVEQIDGVVEDRLDEEPVRIVGNRFTRQLQIPGQPRCSFITPRIARVARAPKRTTRDRRRGCKSSDIGRAWP